MGIRAKDGDKSDDMSWQYPPHLLPYIGVLFLAMAISGALAVYTVVARSDAMDEPSVRAFVGLNAGCALWSGAYALQLLSVELSTKRFWLSIAFVSSILVVVSLFAFAVAYADHERWLTRRTLLAITFVPAVGFVLHATQYRNLYEQPIETTVVDGFVVLDRTLEPAAIVTLLSMYGLVIVAAGFLLKTVYESQRVYRLQSVAVLIAILVPFGPNIAWALGLGPAGNLDLTPVAFTVSGVVLAVAIYRHHLLDIAPVARTAVVEDMRDGFLVIDETGRIRDANAAARRSVAGDAPPSIVGRDVTVLFPDIAPVVREGAPTDQIEIVVDGDDGRRFFDVQVQRLSSADEIRLLLLRDVTEQHAVEQRYQSFIENASDLITMVDDRGIIRYQSPSCTTVLGFAPSELVGRSAFELVHPDDRTQLVEQFRNGLDASIAVDRAEYRLRTADGDWRDVETIGSNLLEDPFVEGVVLNTRDITDRKQREREISRSNEQLERFADVVSHDLRNPLNVAQGYLEAANDDVDCAYHDDIELAHDRMAAIIEDVLRLAREGHPIDDTEPVGLARVVSRAWANVDTGEATRSVASERPIVADEDRLVRLLENLFRNAVEHGSTRPRSQTPEDAGRRRASSEPSVADAPEDAVEHGSETVHVRIGTTPDGFFVEDNGPGIPADDRERVLEYGETSSPSGTGFGLAIVDEIVDGHGWTLRITESGDGGARFEFDTVDTSRTSTGTRDPSAVDDA
ncbi:histidine kinase N-terminal 7TM domain-containing protein [Natronorubrum texcoconense]|uniref:histidine kinase n=1 Tax=Natronorubrum texcoconense TaxID=1095776 RepID=A0A1G8TL61_9EURY|nr:histidine kinase N-terminal 7TM domain-containing protein [Natronorubrum texcoconense]SDJ42193.1 PAS domain S-box-containing protein [Natronorubrum texcoconense]